MKRTLRMFGILFCVCATIWIFTGCSGKTNTGGKMHYDLTAEPINLDPQSAADMSSMTVINQIYEPLFRLDEAGEIVPAAAERYTLSADGLNYRILLRFGLMWQNGDPLDAADYAFALRRILLADTQSPYAGQFFGIRNAKAYHSGKADFSEVGVTADGLYLNITLESPDENFLHLLTTTAAMPCQQKFFDSTKGKYGLESEALLSNGAFYLQSWSHDQYLKLTKNENYYAAEDVKIAGVTMWTNNADSREETFWKGNTQACKVSGEAFIERDTAGYGTQAISDTVYGVVFNQDTACLQNADIRRALAALFDRESYADELPAYLTVTDRAYASDCTVNSKRYIDLHPTSGQASLTVKEAKNLYRNGLSERNVSALSGLKIIVPEDETIKTGDYFLRLSQNYQKYLDLYIGIVRLEKEDYEDAIAAGNYDLAVVPLVSEDFSPVSMLEDFASGHFACSDEKFIRLYREIQKNPENLPSLISEAENLLLADGWFIPMYERQQYFVSGKNTSGITYSPYTGLVSFLHAQYLDE